jgi:hypothetical protein
MRRVLLAVACILLALPCLAQQPISVYVTSIGAVEGMTDPSKGNLDSVKDIRNSITKRKALALVDTRADAVILLVVMGRKTTFMDGNTIQVKMICKGVETDLTGSPTFGLRPPTWGKAADSVAKQVEQWVIANRAKLTETVR